MRDITFVLTKADVAMIIALIPVGLIYLIGYLTGARGDAKAWLGAVIVLIGAAVFSVYG